MGMTIFRMIQMFLFPHLPLLLSDIVYLYNESQSQSLGRCPFDNSTTYKSIGNSILKNSLSDSLEDTIYRISILKNL